jgi:hypothetical protein
MKMHGETVKMRNMYIISRFNEESSQMVPLMFIDMKSQLQNLATLTFFIDGTRK